MTKALASQDKIQFLRTFLADQRDRIANAIPQTAQKYLTPDRICRVVLIAATKTPALLQCTPASIVNSAMQAASYGLEPGGALGEAALVPYGEHCQFQFMARGLVTLAIRHGDVVQVDAEPVYEGDDFDYDLGLAPRLSHRPTLDPDDDAEIVAAYAIATFSDGRKKFKVVHRKDLAKARALSKSPAWTQWQGEMSCKVAIKRLLKTCNLTPEVADAIEADNSTESGGAAALPIDEPRKTRTQSAKERLREQAPPKDSGEASVDAVRNEMLRTGLMKEREPDRTAEGEPLPAEEPNQKGLPL